MCPRPDKVKPRLLCCDTSSLLNICVGSIVALISRHVCALSGAVSLSGGSVAASEQPSGSEFVGAFQFDISLSTVTLCVYEARAALTGLNPLSQSKRGRIQPASSSSSEHREHVSAVFITPENRETGRAERQSVCVLPLHRPCTACFQSCFGMLPDFFFLCTSCPRLASLNMPLSSFQSSLIRKICVFRFLPKTKPESDGAVFSTRQYFSKVLRQLTGGLVWLPLFILM